MCQINTLYLVCKHNDRVSLLSLHSRGKVMFVNIDEIQCFPPGRIPAEKLKFTRQLAEVDEIYHG